MLSAECRVPRRAMLAVVLGLAVASPALADEGLGRLSFPTSGSAAAQPAFVRGMLLLHSFEYDDAADAFREARRIDPGFAMAYWGEALTHHHPLWRYQDRDAALKVLAELGPTAEARRARAGTPREQAYLGSLEVLFADGGQADVLRRYAEAMARIAADYPDDDEARLLHALSMLSTNVERRDFGVDVRAAAIVEEVFMRNPEHPGALHYMIHAYDNPMHAPLGLRAARRYGRLAAHAPHALHMTSHIFLALGMWDEAVAANEASWAASAARVARKRLGPNDHGYHAYLWLAYSYLQQGRVPDARRVVDHMGRLLAEAKSRRVGHHYAMGRAALVVDGEQWRDLPPDAEDGVLSPPARAASRFADGLAAVRRGDLADAESHLAVLASPAPDGGGEAHHGALPTLSPADREGIAITITQLRGVVAIAKGDVEGGLGLLRQAAQAEDAMPYEYGPPFPVKPSRELLGEALLDAGRPAEAAAEFGAALRRFPGRALARRGQTRAGTTAEPRGSR